MKNLDIHQFLIEHVLDPLDCWRIGEGATQRYEREFEKSQFLGREELESLQLQLFQDLVLHAYENCPYYTEQFDLVGFRPTDLTSLDAVSRLPLLDKDTIQRRRDDMVSQTALKADLKPNQTGGSTGAPLSFFVSRDRNCSREAAARRHNRWAGWRVGDKLALVWGASPDLRGGSLKAKLRNLILDRSLILDTSSITDADIRNFHRDFERFRPRIILAYAQSIVRVTKHLRQAGLNITHKPHSIVTSAEMLTDADRALLEDYYGCKVFNRYGCREVAVIATECEYHDGLHIMSEGLYVEILDGTQPAAEGEVGKIVVTDLRNYSMPLIRYQIGDMSSMNYATCRCGRSLPRLNSLEGRLTDFLVADDGRLVSGVFLFTYLLADRPGLGRVQVLQSELNQVCIHLTGIGQPEAELQEDIEHLRQAVAKHLGPGTRFEYKLVSSIPNSASGKFIFCKSEVAAKQGLISPV